MKYTFRCEECDHIDELWGIRTEQRDNPKECPQCGGAFLRDQGLTLQRAFGKKGTTPQHDDIISFMEKNYGHCPEFQPPTSSHTNDGRGTPGGGRHFWGDPKALGKRWV